MVFLLLGVVWIVRLLVVCFAGFVNLGIKFVWWLKVLVIDILVLCFYLRHGFGLCRLFICVVITCNQFGFLMLVFDYVVFCVLCVSLVDVWFCGFGCFIVC